MEVVPWKRAFVLLAAVALALTGVIVTLRADGFAAVDATVPRATRWFVDQANDRVVLVDGFSGRALARLETTGAGQVLDVAQSASGVVVVDRSAATVRTIDAAALRMGPPQSVGLVAEPEARIAVGQAGVVAVDPISAKALLLPPGGDAIPFDVPTGGRGDDTRVAPDGAIWSLAGGRLNRTTTTVVQSFESGLSDARFSLVGLKPLLVDGGRGRVRFGAGEWIELGPELVVDELVVQEPGPSAPCGWIGADDQVWCVGESGIETAVTFDGLDIDGADRLAIAGDAAALIRRNPVEIVRLDWRSGEILDGPAAAPSPAADLEVAVSTDLVWVDQTNGGFVWAVNPWGVAAIRKDDRATPLLGEAGDLLEAGSGTRAPSVRGGEDTTGAGDRDPDDNGIDDPPIAVDDPVTARSGTSVPIAVTANDYDPDGEAIALFSVGTADHGTIEIVSASMVVYQPESGFVGLDEFEYTIVDGDGTEASATVTIELLPVDAPNQAPIGAPDMAETGADAAVTIDVLLNDVDPERDSLRVASFNPPDVGGEITETLAPSGLPGLRYDPPPGASGTATFTYRPVDSFGAVGEPVVVRVEIAPLTDDNRAPITKPDAARVRRDIPVTVPVLANDRDPDGDRLALGLVEPLPPGLEVRIEGNDLRVTARAGASRLSPFAYTVDDGRGGTAFGWVLIALIDELEPNRAPVANADTASGVVGTTQLIDVLANDSDPDGDPLILLRVERVDDVPGAGSIEVRGDRVQYTAAAIVTDDDITIDRFSYWITDGNGHEARGDVSVRVLPEKIAAPPFAQDDAATTVVDVPVTLDVLRNDGDPSGERPTIAGRPGCAGGGQAVVTPDARVTFRPPPGRSGVFSCSYEVVNSQGRTASATIVVSVLEPEITNAAPVVTDREITVVVGESITIDLLDNAVDPDGPRSELRVLSSTRPSLGTATRNGGVVEFDAGQVTGPTFITFQVGDAGNGVTAGRLVIHIVEPDPLPPFANDDSFTITGPAVPTTVAVLSNDGDPDGLQSELRVVAVELVSGDAEISFDATSVVFDAAPDYVGTVVARYTIIDRGGLEATGRVVLTVLEAPNRPPQAGADTATVANGGSVTIPIALNDADADGDALSYSIVTPPDPALGSARLEFGGLVFDAVPGASGTAKVVYRVDDGEATADATVTVTVLPCAESAPVAPDLFFQTGYQQPIAIDLNAAARNGTVVDVGPPLSAAAGVYSPPPGENGNITFKYVVRNGCRLQAVGQVVIDVNQDPVGSAFVTAIGRNESIVIPVTALASDAEPLSIVALEGAPEWMTLTAGGQGIAVAPAGRSGRVDVVAVVADPGGLQARVAVTVDLVNLAPVARPDTVELGDASVTFSPLANDTDPDGDPIRLSAVPETLTFANGEVGTIQRLGNDDLRIDPGAGLGVATFTYTVVDALGLVSAPTTVTAVVNRSPSAPNVDVEVRAGSVAVVTVGAVDPEGQPLVLTILDDPTPLTIGVAQLVLTVTAPPGTAPQELTLGYRVVDPLGAGAEGEIVITVLAPLPTTTTTTTTVPPTTTTVPPTTTTTTHPPTTTTTHPPTHPPTTSTVP